MSAQPTRLSAHYPGISAAPEQPLPPSPSDVLAAPGQPIQLIDGATVTLRYSMASLRRLEARFGSLRGIEVQMKQAADVLRSTDPEAASSSKGGIMTVLSDAIAPGLLHCRVTHPDTGATVRLGADQDLVMEQLDPGQLQNYTNAFAAALSQAFGSEGKAVGETVQVTTLSPGSNGITPPSSSLDGQTDSSGA
jgi:hypothetical protein